MVIGLRQKNSNGFAFSVEAWHDSRRLLTHQAVIVVATTQSGKPELLFKHKEGTVNVTVVGPTIGFLWTRIEYFRWVKSTKEPDQWEKRFPDRETDQANLEKCVKAVRAWFREHRR